MRYPVSRYTNRETLITKLCSLQTFIANPMKKVPNSKHEWFVKHLKFLEFQIKLKIISGIFNTLLFESANQPNGSTEKWQKQLTGISTRLGLFYFQELGNRLRCISIFTSFETLFLNGFSYTVIFKYSYQTLIICPLLKGFMYSYLILISYSQFYGFK